MLGSYAPKTDHTEATDRFLLAQATQALAVGDNRLEAEVSKVFNLEKFYSFWVVEVLVYHSDGYSPWGNNHLIYADPIEKRFQFIPWGVDATFTLNHIPGAFGLVDNPHKSVLAGATLPFRLYSHPQMRPHYMDRLRKALGDGGVWNEAFLLSEVDRMVKLIEPFIEEKHKTIFPSEVENIKEFIKNRRAGIEAEIKDGPVELGRSPTVASDMCTGRAGGPGGCHNGCQYEGCLMPEVPGSWATCHQEGESKMCIHGYAANECVGKKDGTPMPQSTHPRGEESGCYDGHRASQCPMYKQETKKAHG